LGRDFGGATDEIPRGRIFQTGAYAITMLGEGGVCPLGDDEFNAVVAAVERAKAFEPLLINGKSLDWAKAGEVSVKDMRAVVPREEAAIHEEFAALENMGATAFSRQVLLRASCDFRCLCAFADQDKELSFIARRLESLDDYVSRKMYVLALGLMELNGKSYEKGESSEVFG